MNAAVQNSNTLINGTRRQAGFFISVIQEISKRKYTASLTLPVLLISNCLFGILWQMGCLSRLSTYRVEIVHAKNIAMRSSA
jgi:hypothetical protein